MPKNKVKKKKKKRTIRKKLGSSSIEKQLIYKIKKDWVSKAIVNKSQYEKNIKIRLIIMIVSGKKKEKEYPG